jgi:hypothetical protein
MRHPLRLVCSLTLFTLLGLAACSSETLAQKAVRACKAQQGCPAASASSCDEAEIRQNVVGPVEADGCGDPLGKLYDCALRDPCGSLSGACQPENDAIASCRLAKSCGNGTCDANEGPLSCPADCSAS